jgi:sorbitol/mannitol transport system substrate-binding protein
VASAVLAGLTLSGCAFGWGGGVGGGGADTINVLMVNNPQMVDLQKLTREHFTAETGIEVNYTVLPRTTSATRSARSSPARPAPTTSPR